MRCWAGGDPSDSTLTFALMTLLGYARDAERQIGQAQGAATDIEDQLEDVREHFNSPHVEALQRVARDLAGGDRQHKRKPGGWTRSPARR